MSSPFLSETQFSIMEKLDRANGQPVRFNGRMRAAIKKLDDMRLINWTYDVQPDASRGRHKLVFVVTKARP